VSVAAVIVNFRTAPATVEAVNGLLPELAAAPGSTIVVVENQSGDGSLEHLRAALGGPEHAGRVAVVDAGHNGGYGVGINVGVVHALKSGVPPRYIYIVNPDASVEPGSFAALLSFIDAHADVGLVGSTIRGPAGEVQGQAFRFPSAASELETTARLGVISKLLERAIVSLKPTKTTEVDWVPGTSMLVRTEVFTQGGWFDPGFFLYFEEIDFARRLRQAGWKVYYVEGAPITHIGSLSTGMADASRRMPKYWFESRRRYFVKHHGRAYAALSDVAWMLGHALYQAKAVVLPGSLPTRPRLGRDFLQFSLEQLLRPAPFAEQNRYVAAPEAGIPGGSTRYGNGTNAMTAAAARSTPPTAPEDPPPTTFGLIAEDFATHDHDLTAPGFWAVAAHRLGKRALDEGRPWAERAVLEVAYRTMFRGVDWVWGIHLPRTVELGRRVRLWHNGCMLLTAKSIGNDVNLRHDTTFGPLRIERRLPPGGSVDVDAAPVIEDGADIGSGVCVLGGVRVGRRAFVGANSVVLKNVPDDATVLGVPARIVPT